MPEAATRQPLTAKQALILDWIAAQPVPPTIREIGAQFLLKSPNGVNAHLIAMERKGYIRRDRLKSRSIEVIGRQDELLRVLYEARLLAKAYGREQLARDLESQLSRLKAIKQNAKG